MLRKVIYHILCWVICFVLANYTEITGAEKIIIPVFLYKNVVSFIMFYIFWWLGIKYHNKVDVITERKLSGTKLAKYRFFNWPFLTAIIIAVCYLIGGIIIDKNNITEGTLDEIFTRRNEHYQSRFGFAACSILVAYFFTLKDHADKQYLRRKKEMQDKIDQKGKWNSNKEFNLN